MLCSSRSVSRKHPGHFERNVSRRPPATHRARCLTRDSERHSSTEQRRDRDADPSFAISNSEVPTGVSKIRMNGRPGPPALGEHAKGRRRHSRCKSLAANDTQFQFFPRGCRAGFPARACTSYPVPDLAAAAVLARNEIRRASDSTRLRRNLAGDVLYRGTHARNFIERQSGSASSRFVIHQSARRRVIDVSRIQRRIARWSCLLPSFRTRPWLASRVESPTRAVPPVAVL